jgi:hypothetical protein
MYASYRYNKANTTTHEYMSSVQPRLTACRHVSARPGRTPLTWQRLSNCMLRDVTSSCTSFFDLDTPGEHQPHRATVNPYQSRLIIMTNENHISNLHIRLLPGITATGDAMLGALANHHLNTQAEAVMCSRISVCAAAADCSSSRLQQHLVCTSCC